jgi:hypothetical protein
MTYLHPPHRTNPEKQRSVGRSGRRECADPLRRLPLGRRDDRVVRLGIPVANLNELAV